MSYALPTVRVAHPEHPDGILINESDLTDEHTLQDAEAETARRKPAKAAKTATLSAKTAATEKSDAE